MAKVGRNEPCPCGSGAKVKRCCGTEAALETLELRADTLQELLDLAELFPRLRPSGAAFSHWADRIARRDLSPALLEEGLGLLEDHERDRIEHEHERDYPHVWRTLCDDLGSDAIAAEAAVIGAVVAAVDERRPPDDDVLELLEGSAEARRDPCEALALVLRAGDLWSVHESVQVEAAIAAIPDDLDDDEYEKEWNATLEREAGRLATEWHDERLATLVARLAGHLPFRGRPAASAALAGACETLARDPELRARLAAFLLGETLSWQRLALAA